MTRTEVQTITAAHREIENFMYDGYRKIDSFNEPNNVISVVLQHKRTLRTLIITCQPRWGMVLIKEGKRILKVMTFG